jgi:hypothetical protein
MSVSIDRMESGVSRRVFLRGMGVLVALPALDAFGAPKAPTRRMVAVNIPLGFHPPYFFPEQAGRDYVLSPYLKAAEPLRQDLTVISGTSHPECDGGHETEKTFLTAAPHPGSRSFKNTISLDQKVAREIGTSTRFASMSLGDHSLAWSANGVSIPMINEPAEAFARLFIQGSAKDVAAQKRQLEDGRSIMDTVLDDARSIEGKVGAADRDKLDQYFTAVRETEQRLTKAGAWADTPKPAVTEKSPPRYKGEDVTGRLRGHFQVIRLALATDSCRVFTLGGNSGSPVLPLKGVDTGYHGLSHHGKNPQLIAQLEIVDRDTITAWLEFLTALKQTPDGDSTLLANTQVLLGSNLGNANGHLTVNLPIVLAGGPWKHGQHLAFDSAKNYPLARLFVSMMQGLGLDVGSFASGAGTMQGLERA